MSRRPVRAKRAVVWEAVSYTHLDVYKRQPSGASIHGQGVTPDIEVALAADASVIYHAPDAASDAQLAAALEALGHGA